MEQFSWLSGCPQGAVSRKGIRVRFVNNPGRLKQFKNIKSLFCFWWNCRFKKKKGGRRRRRKEKICVSKTVGEKLEWYHTSSPLPERIALATIRAKHYINVLRWIGFAKSKVTSKKIILFVILRHFQQSERWTLWILSVDYLLKMFTIIISRNDTKCNPNRSR